MITDVIVLLSLVLAAAFSVAWLMRPGLRARIEKPKYRFQENVKHYDSIRSVRS